MPFKNGTGEKGFINQERQFDKEENVSKIKIFSNHGYNIQSDNMKEKATHTDFISNGDEKKKPLYEKAAVMEAVKNIEKNRKAETTTHPDSKYIFYDETNSKTGEFINDVFQNGHDKVAIKSSTTDVAGGAQIESVFLENGKLKSEIILNQGKERTDRQGFSNATATFLEKVDDIFLATNFEENEAAASYVDEFGTKIIDQQKRKALREAARFSEIKSEAKQEIKTIKKEKKRADAEKEPSKASVVAEQSIFKESNAKFVENDARFFDKYAEMFKENTSDAKRKLLFGLPITKKIEKKEQLRTVAASHTSIFNSEEKSGRASFGDEKERAEIINDTSKAHQEALSESREKIKGSFLDNGDDNQESARTIPDRFMTNEEKIVQEKAKKQAADKGKNKQLRRAAAATALSNTLRIKKEAQNELGDMSGTRVTGDLINDGKGSVIATMGMMMSQGIQNLARALMRKVVTNIIAFMGAALGSVVLPLIVVLACSMILFVGYADTGEVYDLNLGGDGLTYQSLSTEQIDEIISSLYATYNIPELDIYDMGPTQERILRYALSKVGCPYDQGKHWSLTEDIFDCSSLAMRAYREAGINIKNQDAFSAAEICRAMENQNKVVGNDLIPGDLIFYGGQANGRYRGIYHVAIYVGNGKMVEARGKRWGVVYGDVRSNNVVICARPFR